MMAGAVLSDVGSTKQSVIRDVGPLVPPGVHFVPAHPLAGTEHSGPDAGFAELFEGRWCLLTPPPGTDAPSVAKMEQFWRGLGSMVSTMDPAIAFTVAGVSLATVLFIAAWMWALRETRDDMRRNAALRRALERKNSKKEKDFVE